MKNIEVTLDVSTTRGFHTTVFLFAEYLLSNLKPCFLMEKLLTEKKRFNTILAKRAT